MLCPTCQTLMEKTADSEQTIGFQATPRFSDYGCTKCPAGWRYDQTTTTFVRIPEQPRGLPELNPTPWDSLSERDKMRVEELIGSLSEFEVALHHSARVRRALPSSVHPLGRFFAHGFTTYLHGFYLAGGLGVQNVLRSINLGNVAGALDQMAKTQVGETTFGGYVSELRNTRIAHPSFDPKIFLERVSDKAPLEDPAVMTQFRPSFRDLMDATRFIHVLLRRTYPIAAAAEDARWKPVDNPPSPGA